MTTGNRAFAVTQWGLPSRITIWVLAIACVALAASPLFAGPAFLSRSVALFVYILLAVSWNALAGYAGLLSVGQQVFFGLGAYLAIRLANAGLPAVPSLLIAAVAVAIIAIPVSSLMLRLKGGEFAIGMWVLASLCHLFVNLDPLIQGETGTSLIALNAMSASTRLTVVYLFALVAAAGLVLAMVLVLRSRFGGALQAIRDSEEAAGSVGVEVFRTKQVIFVFAAFGAALAGVIWLAGTITFQPKAYFSVQWMAYTIFMVIVGGIGTLEGAILGALIFFVLETIFGAYGVSYLLVLGAAAVTFAIAFPQGLWGFVSRRSGIQLFPLSHRFRLLSGGEKSQGDRK